MCRMRALVLIVVSLLQHESAAMSELSAACDVEVEESTLLQQRAAVRRQNLQALFVVGTDPGEPLHADLVFQERLEVFGYKVTLIRDKKVTLEECEKYDAMLISASVGGGNIKHRTDNCTTPQLIWEVGLYNFNGMSGPGNDEAWVTSEWWNTNHQDSWVETGFWPPAPTGRSIVVTPEGSKSQLAAGFKGEVPFWAVEHDNYGVNWANVDKLGKGAKVVAILPPDASKEWPAESAPGVHKAVLFYYEKGSELYCGRGKSPAFRIGFPPYGFIYGPSPTCEELKQVPNCKTCLSNCQTVEEVVGSNKNPMPLSCDGVKMLDAAVKMLIEQAPAPTS